MNDSYKRRRGLREATEIIARAVIYVSGAESTTKIMTASELTVENESRNSEKMTGLRHIH